MGANFEIEEDLIAEQNKALKAWLAEDFEHLGDGSSRRDVNIEDLVEKAQKFKVAVPSWGVGTGGTRFARFPGIGRAAQHLSKSSKTVRRSINWFVQPRRSRCTFPGTSRITRKLSLENARSHGARRSTR